MVMHVIATCVILVRRIIVVRVMRWGAVLLVTGLLSGCAALGTPQSSLPPPSALPCCWQSQERVQVSTGEEEHTFLAALAVSPQALTVVVLDDLGRRLLTLVHDGVAVTTLDAPPGWPERLSSQLLLAIYLHQLAPEQWLQPSGDWSVSDAGGSRTLLYRGKEHVRLHYAAVGVTVPVEPFAQPRRIDFVGQEVQIHVVTLSHDPLSSDLNPASGAAAPHRDGSER